MNSLNNIGKVANRRDLNSFRFRKRAFSPSPQTQGAVEQQAAPPNQDPNAQAVAPSGITLDDVAGMIDTFYQEFSANMQQLQTQLSQLQTMIPMAGNGGKGSGGGGGGNSNNGGGMDMNALNTRLMKLEQMLLGAMPPAPPMAGGGAGGMAPQGMPPQGMPQTPMA